MSHSRGGPTGASARRMSVSAVIAIPALMASVDQRLGASRPSTRLMTSRTSVNIMTLKSAFCRPLFTLLVIVSTKYRVCSSAPRFDVIGGGSGQPRSRGTMTFACSSAESASPHAMPMSRSRPTTGSRNRPASARDQPDQHRRPAPPDERFECEVDQAHHAAHEETDADDR